MTDFEIVALLSRGTVLLFSRLPLTGIVNSMMPFNLIPKTSLLGFTISLQLAMAFEI
jgi:hypothetical protein